MASDLTRTILNVARGTPLFFDGRSDKGILLLSNLVVNSCLSIAEKEYNPDLSFDPLYRVIILGNPKDGTLTSSVHNKALDYMDANLPDIIIFGVVVVPWYKEVFKISVGPAFGAMRFAEDVANLGSNILIGENIPYQYYTDLGKVVSDYVGNIDYCASDVE
jgi:hypothetical protein